jgi:hypothetical protein
MGFFTGAFNITVSILLDLVTNLFIYLFIFTILQCNSQAFSVLKSFWLKIAISVHENYDSDQIPNIRL